MSEITESLFETIEILAQKIVKENQGSITIECRIEEIVNAGIGLYKVSYMDNQFNVYSNGIETIYDIGDTVYVLVPNGDFSKTKMIIGATSPNILTYVNNDETTKYNEKSENILQGTFNDFKLISYNENKNEENGQVGIFELTDSTGVIKEYMKDYSYIKIGCNIKTSLNINQRVSGNYGLKFNIPFIDANGEKIVRTYVLDVSNILGNPYDLATDSDQKIIFKVENERYDYTRKITMEVFCHGFSQNINVTDPDIFINNINMYFIDNLTQNEIDSYSLNIKSSTGRYFTQSFLQDKNLIPELKVKGNITSISGLECYWFKENNSINISSEFYNEKGGFGWECLNPKEIISTSEDGNINYGYTKNVYSYKVSKSDIPTSIRYKCVIIYQDNIISGIIELSDLTATAEVILKSENDCIAFAKDIGDVNLTCELKGYECPETSKILYYWNRYDMNQCYIETFDTMRSYLNFPVSSIDTMNVIGVTVIELTNKNVEKIIGTKYISLSNVNTADFYISMINGNKTFKYDADGNSPLALDDQFEIKPLSFKLYTSAGTELSSSEYEYAQIKWCVPKENTMIKYNGKLQNDEIISDDTYYYYPEKDFYYTIHSRYNKNYTNNSIKVIINYGSYVITGEAYLNFIKDGSNGTNGTSLSARIKYLDSKNKENQLRLLFDSSSNKWYNISENRLINFTNIGLRAEVYDNDIQLNSGYSISWAMFDPDVNNPSLNISNNGILSIKKNVWATIGTVYNNIAEATITINNNNFSNQSIVVRYPIDVIRISSIDALTIFFPRVTGGFKEVLYASDGTNPQYDSSTDFKINSNMLTDEYDNKLSYNWNTCTNINIKENYGYGCKCKPVTKYDNGNSKNYITANLSIPDTMVNVLSQERQEYELEYNQVLEDIQSLKITKEKLSNYIKLFDYDQLNDLLSRSKDFLDKRGSCIYYCNKIIKDLNNFKNFCDSSNNIGNINFDLYIEKIEQIKQQLYNLCELSNFSLVDSYFTEIEYEIPSYDTVGFVAKVNMFEATIPTINLEFKVLNSDIEAMKQQINGLHYFNQFCSEIKKLDSSIYLTDYENLRSNINTIYNYFLNKEKLEYYDYYHIQANVLNRSRQLIFYYSDANKELNVETIKEFDELSQNLEKKKELLYNKITSIEEISKIENVSIFYVKPIIMTYNQYEMSNINAWDGNKIYTGMNDEYLLAPQIGAGKKENDNSFTGIIMGLRSYNKSNYREAGLYGYYHGIQTIKLDSETGSAIFGASGDGQIKIIPYGTSTIAGWEINSDSLTRSSGNNKVTLSSNSSETGKAFEATNGINSTYIQYNGFLYSDTGKIGGWNINKTTLKSDKDKIVLDSENSKITLGRIGYNDDQLLEGIVIDGTKETLEIGSHFSVEGDGTMIADNGWIGSKNKGLHLTSTGLYNDDKSLILSSANGLKCKKGNIGSWYIDSKSLFMLKDGYDYDTLIKSGDLTDDVKQVYIKGNGSVKFGDKFSINSKGEIKAEGGTIGGWHIDDDGLYNASKKSEATVKLLANGQVEFGKFFKVSKDGDLTANSGKIGGWKISENGLWNGLDYSSGNKILLRSQSGDGEDACIALGKYFKVTSDGTLTAKTGKIGNWKINDGNLVATDGGVTLNGKTGEAKFGLNFVVSPSGTITANAGTIGGWNIGNGKLTGGTLTLNKSGAIAGSNWSITAGGEAHFSNLNATGGKIAMGGATISGGSGGTTKLGESCTNVGSKNIGTYVGDICANTIKATKIKTSQLEVDTVNGKSVSWKTVHVVTDLSAEAFSSTYPGVCTYPEFSEENGFSCEQIELSCIKKINLKLQSQICELFSGRSTQTKTVTSSLGGW